NDVVAAYLTSSAGMISGVFALSYADNRLSIKTENTKVSLPAYSSTAFNYSGTTILVLPDAIIREGTGKLSVDTFVFEYKNLSYNPHEGIFFNFTAQTPLTSQKIIPLPNALTGFLYAEGQYKKKIPSGVLQIKNFSFKESALSLDADTLAMAFEGSMLFVKKQRVRLNKKWPIENLSLRLGATSSTLSVENLSMVLARGTINATYILNRQTKVQNLKLSASHIKAQDLSALFSLKTTVFGNVTAAGQLSFAGFNAESIGKSLSGNLSLQIGRGKIKDSFFQKGIFTGPLYKLEQKFSDIEFASGTADVLFSQGNIHARKVFFDAEEWNVKLRAEANR
ncbi:MAG TPA: AsmA-like C-terminal region-containing protein, partial [Turneriella sp.]|nr:AsmA-like C-terminal region-containing protein [Turneriella sp.]